MSANFCRLLGVICILLFLNMVCSKPLENGELQLNEITPEFGVEYPSMLDQDIYLQTRSHILRQMVKNEPNQVLNEMFDNITEHYISYSSYLRTAPTTELMLLRIKALQNYNDAASYTGVVAKFDKFVQDFRPETIAYDKFAFSTIDFLMFPGLSVQNYTLSELKKFRTNVINTLPTYITEEERNEFIRVIDTIFLTRQQ